MSEVTDAMDENDRERQRLARLVAGLDAGALAARVHDAWTVGAKLAHLALWDRIALGHLERWAAREAYVLETPQWYDDLLNDAMLPEALTLHGAAARQPVLAAAEAIDRRLRSIEDGQAERLLVDRDTGVAAPPPPAPGGAPRRGRGCPGAGRR